jgi:Flp pilus assembly protein TadD
MMFVQGRYEDAVSEYRKTLSVGVTYASEGLGAALARSGNVSEARRELTRLIQQSDAGQPGQVYVAATYLALGEPDSAFMWLDKAYELRDGNLPWVRITPFFDDLRSDPRYVALMKRLRLEP